MKNKLNFTVGPVQSDDCVKEIGKLDVPYFRTSEFSELMLENENLIKDFAKANNESKVIFITGSGTASMEASVMNTLTEKDKVLVVNGGSFGKRFVELLELHNISYTEIKKDIGENITEKDLANYNNKDYTAFVVNMHETSTGVLYDMDLISRFCKDNNLFLIVDAISSFLADKINMQDLGIDVLITGSQKALACPPGISIIVLSKEAVEKVYNIKSKCMYLDLKSALENAKRGQTPFTPAVGTLIQINARLREIKENGGVEEENKRIENLAKYFREQIKDMPFKMVTSSPSNAVTSLYSLTKNANDIFLELKDNYDIWVCPNGGNLKDKVFRVGHIGNLKKEDYDRLINALKDMQKRNLI